MVLQNRTVLDLLVASKGGVCAMVGKTFIPANTDGGGAVRSGIANMSAIAKVMAATDRGLRYRWVDGRDGKVGSFPY